MRFPISNPPAGDLELPDLEALLDARQSWQPAGRHLEVRAAWAERARYLPPGAHRPQLPPPPHEDPEEPSEQQQRRQAWEMMKQGHRASRRRPRAPMVGVTVVILLLVLMAWGIVAFAGGLSRVAGAVVRAEVGR